MHNDYLMQQMEIASRCLAHHFQLGQVVHEITDPYQNEEANELNKKLMDLLADGKINDAEDLLFEAACNDEDVDKEYQRVALDFYLKLGLYNDEYLELCNFSRNEVSDGWSEITMFFQD